MLQVIILSGWLIAASVAQITGYGNQAAVYGGDARYGCAVANPTGVLQVTWQRLFKDESIETLATYSKRFGLQVNPPFVGKVVFTEATLSSTSIMVKNVTWEDESCYVCSFNTYPDGSTWSQTCLTVEGISETWTGVLATTSARRGGGEPQEEEVVIGCSATGKPAPSIRWVPSPDAAEVTPAQISTSTNQNGTITSSGNVTVRAPAGWRGHVDCVMNAGMAGERRERFSISLGSGTRNEEEGTFSHWLMVALVAGSTLLIILIITISTVFVVKQRRIKDTL
ncbi:OX-2 membrane glycoprotein-like [Antennarius striatus]|uniref:OX-2 membrane glycoprotein-like n=1 Tax=Antennarius striatus TaxID=241820 RepID=UPI0035AEB4F0